LIDTMIDIMRTPLVIAVLALGALVALADLIRTRPFLWALPAIGRLITRVHHKNGDSEPLNTVVEDWKPTGCIDFSVPSTLRGAVERRNEPGFFYLTVEERRLIRTIVGPAAAERRWRRASLSEAREAAANYHIFLREHPEKVLNDDPREIRVVRNTQAFK
jgi:hypothetical protein